MMLKVDARSFVAALEQCRWAIFTLDVAMRRFEHDTEIAAASGWGECEPCWEVLR